LDLQTTFGGMLTHRDKDPNIANIKESAKFQELIEAARKNDFTLDNIRPERYYGGYRHLELSFARRPVLAVSNG
jgi:hypothetical protein